jgi:NADH dehydrogenase
MAARILILGGGFAGLGTARKLERLLRPEEATITLVSRENFSLFTPMLPEVGSGNLETRHVVTPVRAQLRRAAFVLGEVRSVDVGARAVDVVHPLTGTHLALSYDHLVIALGAISSTFGLPGIAERSLAYKTLEDADRLRNHVIAALETAAVTTDPAERKRLLTFVFVGGGFTGVEAAGEMGDFFRSSLRFYRTLAPAEVRIVLIEGGKKLLPELQAGMGEYSAKALARRGIEVMLETMVAGAGERGLQLKDGRTIETKTIVWSAGVRPSPIVAEAGLASGRAGSIAVREDFSVEGMPGVWAIGDCASIPMPDGSRAPATAQHALREGPLLARNIAATLRAQPTAAFRYTAIGMMASLGARRGVAGLFERYLITGFPAWLIWRTYYLLRLPGLDRKVRVALDWTLGLIFPRDIAELRVDERSPDVQEMAEAQNPVGTCDS